MRMIRIKELLIKINCRSFVFYLNISDFNFFIINISKFYQKDFSLLIWLLIFSRQSLIQFVFNLFFWLIQTQISNPELRPFLATKNSFPFETLHRGKNRYQTIIVWIRVLKNECQLRYGETLTTSPYLLISY